MKEPQALNEVAEFHETFGAPILKSPTIPLDRAQLRINLLQEELNELKEAVANNDLVEAADALADLQYVLSGAILEFGLGDKFADLFSEVHRSNMSKACKSLEDVKETQEYYKERGEDSEIVQKGENYIVYRKSDNKVLKNRKYSPADVLSKISNDY